MPVASNPLLQTGAAAKPARAVAGTPDKAPQAFNDKAPGFSQVYSQQSRDKAAPANNLPANERSKPVAAPASNGKVDEGKADKVADSGKTLPDDQDVPVDDPAQAGDALATDPQVLDQSLVAGQVTDAQPGAQLIQAQAEAVAPVVQAAAAQLQAQAAVATTAVPEEPPFDPASDPLADLPAVRLALEQNAQAQGTTSAHAKGANTQPDPAASQPAVNTLAAMLGKTDAEPGQDEPGEKAFSGLLEDGLKDLKGAASDTRVDDFANRLSALTQAATPKTANAVPVAVPTPLGQPLAMHQGGWTEGLVNRVMYLSSQNLKSADIQLQPAELGRLDIRVNLSPEQQAQITFTSGHAGVREALEGQVGRLKEMFVQQGLGQPDVNVADQQRGQQQGQQDDSPRLSGVAARRNEAGTAGEADDAQVAAAMPVEQQSVVGSSVVDFYA
ncbi:flagellar hook-length control protein FliK [Pseudomonas fontis]|uniref:Flagellar hook-length control protein FliK n=1 Tax=Pseudomonas fontis TaxID=2942633 RepID=A0ABT5NQQ5_9PSED|nr:flagellar hook-length control protein FliK [Pseudomonas fontis]MDD0974576.1 flagellar hook-length control protein FliK [Pseudomonas fontis]MDD0990481.1 flagellar hook-length control protein FliK [Pseudomonas fontis]